MFARRASVHLKADGVPWFIDLIEGAAQVEVFNVVSATTHKIAASIITRPALLRFDNYRSKEHAEHSQRHEQLARSLEI